jgi:hypothetical protein
MIVIHQTQTAVVGAKKSLCKKASDDKIKGFAQMSVAVS